MTKTNEIGWNFDNSYARLSESFFARSNPTPVKKPELVILNSTLAEELGLHEGGLKRKESIEIFAGNEIPPGGFPIAQAYAGHQFGNFTMLGDGRAVLLGEQITPTGKRFDIQLKGAGKTPFSRGGDGRAALGPMLREYIISEAMHGLGIPTSRSLAVVTTGEEVIRETELPGAILTRVASSHIRVGTFQFIANWGSLTELKSLTDYTINRHYPEVKESDNPYLAFLQSVITRQAELISKWQLVGFIHGVMNTDNMTISGETIDYGPCAFMDTYHLDTVFSSIDTQGRYAYANQPYIAAWNLARFAETLIPFLHEEDEKALKIAQEEISKFTSIYEKYWLHGMRAKLGLATNEYEDDMLVDQLLGIMQKHEADYTNTFRALTLNELKGCGMFQSPDFQQWYQRWEQRKERESQRGKDSIELMKNANPAIIPRNHRVEEVLENAVNQGDYSDMTCLLSVLKNPYNYTDVIKEFTLPPEPTDTPYRTYCGT